MIAKTEDGGYLSTARCFRGMGANIMRGVALGIADNKSLDTILREHLGRRNKSRPSLSQTGGLHFRRDTTRRLAVAR